MLIGNGILAIHFSAITFVMHALKSAGVFAVLEISFFSPTDYSWFDGRARKCSGLSVCVCVKVDVCYQ